MENIIVKNHIAFTYIKARHIVNVNSMTIYGFLDTEDNRDLVVEASYAFTGYDVVEVRINVEENTYSDIEMRSFNDLHVYIPITAGDNPAKIAWQSIYRMMRIYKKA